MRNTRPRFCATISLGYAMIAEGAIGCDISDLLGAISVPTLVAVGRHDQLAPSESLGRYTSACHWLR